MLKGALVLFLEQLLKKGVLFISTLLLAHFLSPADFGLVAIAAFIIGLSNSFVESGLRDFIIREAGLRENILSTAYWINNFFAVVAYLIIIAISPLIADSYGEKALLKILPIISLSTILFSQQVVPLGIIHRHQKFPIILKANLTATFFSSAVSIYMAYNGYGIWSLIAQTLLSASITSIILFIKSGFRPSFIFNKSAAVKLLSFGAPLFLSNILSTASKNLLFLIPGKLLGVTVSGYLYMADKIMETIMSQVVYSVQQSSYPSLVSYSSESNELKKRYANILVVTATAVTSILGFVFVMAESVTILFFSREWNGLQVYVMGLSAAYFLYPMHALNLNILKAMGKTKLYFYLDIYKIIMNAFVITLTASISVHALLAGMIFLSVINLIPNGYHTKKLIGYSFKLQFTDYLKSSLVPIIATAFVFTISNIFFKPGFLSLVFSATAYIILVFFGLFFTKNALSTLLLLKWTAKC